MLFKCRKNIGLQQLATHWDLTFRSKSNSMKRIAEKLNLFELVKLLGKCFTTCSPMYHISRTQFGQKLNRESEGNQMKLCSRKFSKQEKHNCILNLELTVLKFWSHGMYSNN
jgi:hypothetical protein